MEAILESTRQPSRQNYAEITRTKTRGNVDCDVTAGGDKKNLVATVFAHVVTNGKISRIDMCGDPSPSATIISGEYPS